MPAETASGNEGSIPSQGSWRDPLLYTQTSRARLGGQGGGASLRRSRPRLPRQRPHQPGPPASSRHCTSGGAGGRQPLTEGQERRQRLGRRQEEEGAGTRRFPYTTRPLIKGPEPQGWRHPETDSCGLGDQLRGSGRRHSHTQTHKHTLAAMHTHT